MNGFESQLTAFEELFLLRDCIDAPSSFFVKLELSDRLDQTKAQAALDKVCELHPLASCSVEEKGRRFFWTIEAKPIAIQWHDQSFSTVGYPSSWFDSMTQRPMKVSCFPSENGGMTILFHVHHVAFDGLGFLQLLRDWWTIYCGRESMPQYDKKKLSHRCRPRVSFLEALKLLPGQWKSIRAATQVFGRKVIPFVASEHSEIRTHVVPSVISKTLSADETKTLRQLARSKNVSTNTVLARNLYVAIHRWQTKHKIAVEGSHYRLVMPFNERHEEHNSMSACNHCTVISFDRSPEEFGDPETLLSSIQQEVNVIKRWRLSLNFWRVLRCLRLLPGGIQNNASTQRVTATTLFSNLGNLDRSLPMLAESEDETNSVTDIEFVATLHHGMAIALIVYEFHGRIRITMQYDRRVLDKPTANGFMDLFVQSNR